MSEDLDNVKVDAPVKKKKLKKLKLKTVLFSLVLIIAIGAIGFLVWQNQDLKKNPNKIISADQKKLLDKVGGLIDLPKDEQPSIATVSDKEKLKSQAFFKNAQNGDTLLIYTNSKKAILYRESTNKVIEVAPIAIDTTAGGTQSTTTEKK